MGELSLFFEAKTAEIIRLTDWDTMKSNKYANIRHFFILYVRDRTSFEYPLATYPVSYYVPDLRCHPAWLVHNTST